MFLAAGAKLDKYEVIAPLAVGGMAELYVARSLGIEGFEKLCVLKRILPQYARDDEFVQMFLDEARLAATLHHPNVIQVYDIGISDGRYYFTMEYVHGQDLASLVAAARSAGRGLRLEHSIAIVAGVAAGLHHAHEQRGPDGTPLGIVHRDVSPTNILVSYDGNIKVVDFGIAKAVARRTHTTAGGAKGKLSYMSPEQVRADRGLDRRSDVFSLGIVLYELTTGRSLFRGDSDYLIADQIIGARIPPPTTIRATYPEALEQIVMKALARAPEDRYATAREMQLALEELARTEQLQLSSVGVSEYMGSLFPDQVTAWSAAARDGRSLVDHVTSIMVTRLASSWQTRRDAPRRRWTALIAPVALAIGIAGWVVVFQQRRGPEREEPGSASAPTPGAPANARPTGTGEATPGAPATARPTGTAPTPPAEPGSAAGPPSAASGSSASAAAGAPSTAPTSATLSAAPSTDLAKRKRKRTVRLPTGSAAGSGSAVRPGVDGWLDPDKPPPKDSP